MARRRHRVLRAVARAIATLVTLVLAAIAAVLVALTTDWGREQVRRITEAQLNRIFHAKVSVGRITGSVLSRFSVDGLTVDDASGKRVITVGTVRADWEPLALIGQRVHAHAIEVTGPVVVVARQPDGSINLAHLLPTPKPGGGPSPWRVALDKVVVRDGFVTLPVGAGGMTLANVGVDGAVQVAPGVEAVALARAAATWIERGLPLDARGRFVSSRRLMQLSAFEAHAGGSRLAVPFALYEPQDRALAAMIDAAVREADTFQVWPHPVALGDATLGGAVTGLGRGAPLEARLHASALHGQIWTRLAADLEKPGIAGELRARGVRAPGPIAARGDVDASFDVAGKTLETARGTLALTARADVAGRTIDRLKVDAVVGGGVARADATVSAAGGTGRAHADVRLQQPIVVDGARLRAELPDIGALAPGVKGSGSVDVTVRGTPQALEAKGRAHADRIAAGPARAASADVDFDVTRRGMSFAGSARLDAHDVAAAAMGLGRVRADARLGAGGRTVAVNLAVGGAGVPYAAEVAGQVTLAPTATRIDVRELALSAHGLALNGHGGSVVVHRSGALDADRLGLASAAGTVEVTGHLAAPRPGAGRFTRDGELHLHVVGLDLGRLRTAFAPEAASIAGKISLDLHAVRDGTKLGVEGEYLAEDVIATRRVPPIDALGRINVGNGRLVASGHVRERITGGIVDYAIESEVPRQALDAQAWKRLDLDAALRGGIVHLRQLDVGTLAELAHAHGYKGRIDGVLSVEPGTRALALTLKGRGIEAPGLKAVGLDAKGTWDHEALDLGVEVAIADRPVLAIKGRTRVGLHALADGLVDLGSAPIEVHAESHALELARLRPALESNVNLGGRADLDVDVAGTMAKPTAKARLLIGAARVAKVEFQNLEVNANLEPARITATVSARQQQGGTLDGDAAIDRASAAAASAEIRAKDFDLGFLPALAHGATDALAGVGGKLDANLRLAVTPDGRTLQGQASVRDGSFYVPMSGLVDRVELKAGIENGRLSVEKLTGRTGAGSISGKVQATFDGPVPRDFSAELKVDRLPVQAGATVVTVSTDGKITAKNQNGAYDMTATLRGATVRVPNTSRPGGKLQSTGKLQDVVFIDEPDFMQRTGFEALGGDYDKMKSGGALNVNIKLETPNGVRVTGQEIELSLRPDLVIHQRAGQVSIGGGIETQTGYLDLFGQRWDVTTANLSFDEADTTINPRLNIELQHQYQSTTAYVGVTGTLQQPKLSLRAEPGAYEQQQILSWVLGGSPDDTAGDKTTASDKAAGMASSVLLGQVQSQLRHALPIDVLSVHMGEGTEAQTTRVEVGKWLNDSLFLGYRARINAPENENANEADIKWRLGGRWLLDAYYGDKSVGSADVLWSTRY
jgi:translocation and assembly module TamB